MVFKTYLFHYGKTLILFCIAVYAAGHYLDLVKLKILGVVLFGYFWYFFRIPRFYTRVEVNSVKAPAYGKIQKIRTLNLDGRKYYQISTFISVFDEHIQYSPVSGALEDMTYKEGNFNAAGMFQKSNDNERLVYKAKTRMGAVYFSQIAGLLARTIVSFRKKGEKINQGEEIGLIKLGSRADVFIPATQNMSLLVNEGDKVKGGQTQFAVYH